MINKKIKILNYLQRKWRLQSIRQVLSILAVFTFSGSTVILLKPLFFKLVGVVPTSPISVKIMYYVIFVLPMYQVLLLGFGWVFGQIDFFTNKIMRLRRSFLKSFR